MTSQRSAMGKSLYVQCMTESLKFNMKNSSDSVLVTIPIHGPVVTDDVMLNFFTQHLNKPNCCIYHIDISSSVRFYINFCIKTYFFFAY